MTGVAFIYLEIIRLILKRITILGENRGFYAGGGYPIDSEGSKLRIPHSGATA